MSAELQRILARISQHGSAGQVAARHDGARLTAEQHPTRVDNHEQFAAVIGAFVNRQVQLTGGQTYAPYEARAVAKEMLNQYGRRYELTYNNYARDAIDGRNGGLRAVLDILTDLIRDQQTSRYISDTIDQYVDPLSYDQKVAVTQQVIDHFRRLNPDAIDDPRPEVHAQNYVDMLRELNKQIDTFSNRMRRD